MKPLGLGGVALQQRDGRFVRDQAAVTDLGDLDLAFGDEVVDRRAAKPDQLAEVLDGIGERLALSVLRRPCSLDCC